MKRALLTTLLATTLFGVLACGESPVDPGPKCLQYRKSSHHSLISGRHVHAECVQWEGEPFTPPTSICYPGQPCWGGATPSGSLP